MAIFRVRRITLPPNLNDTVDVLGVAGDEATHGPVRLALLSSGPATVTSNPINSGGLVVGFYTNNGGAIDQRVCAVFRQDNVAPDTANSAMRSSDNTCCMLSVGVGGHGMKFVASPITDGIRLTKTLSLVAFERFVDVLLQFGGNARSSSILLGPNSGDTVATSANTFTPRTAFFTNIGVATPLTISSNPLAISFGVANATQQRSIIMAGTLLTPTQGNILFSDTRVGGQLGTDVVLYTVEAGSWTSNNLSLTTRDGNSNGDVTFYCLSDQVFDIGTIAAKLAIGTDTFTLAGTPQAVLATMTTAPGTTIATGADANAISIGMADATSNLSHSTGGEDAATITNTYAAASTTLAIDLDSSAAGVRSDQVDATIALTAGAFNVAYGRVSTPPTALKGFYAAAITPAAPGAPALTWTATQSQGTINTPTAGFTAAGTDLAGNVLVTPSGPGVWSPLNATLNTASPSASFSFTGTTLGGTSLPLANNAGITAPAALVFEVVPAVTTPVTPAAPGEAGRTIRVTITSPGMSDSFGRPLVVGQTYTVEYEFGKSLIFGLRATDTDGALSLGGNAPFEQGISTQTLSGSSVLEPGDQNQILVYNSTSPGVLTIPQDSVAHWQENSTLVVYIANSGIPAFAAGPNVTLRAPSGLTAGTQYGFITAARVGANEWTQV